MRKWVRNGLVALTITAAVALLTATLSPNNSSSPSSNIQSNVQSVQVNVQNAAAPTSMPASLSSSSQSPMLPVQSSSVQPHVTVVTVTKTATVTRQSSPATVSHGAPAAPFTPPSPIYLADLALLNGNAIDTDSLPVLAGLQSDVHFVSAVTGGCGRDQDNRWPYALSGKYAMFKSDVAMEGTDPTDTPNPAALVEIMADNQILFDKVMHDGDIAHVSASVAGRSILTIREKYLGPSVNTCYNAGRVFWGNALVSPR